MLDLWHLNLAWWHYLRCVCVLYIILSSVEECQSVTYCVPCLWCSLFACGFVDTWFFKHLATYFLATLRVVISLSARGRPSRVSHNLDHSLCFGLQVWPNSSPPHDINVLQISPEQSPYGGASNQSAWLLKLRSHLVQMRHSFVQWPRSSQTSASSHDFRTKSQP